MQRVGGTKKMKSSGNSKYLKKLNRMTIVNIIRDNELISRQQIAELTGLTPAAVTGIIRELIIMGFVDEVGLGESQGGRRPVELKFNCAAGYVIGIEVTSQEIAIAIADLKNYPTDINRKSVDMSNPDLAIKALVTMVEQIIHSEEHQGKKFFGVAIAFPGLLRVNEGIIKRSINLGKKWREFPLKAALENEVGLPVFIENNPKVATMGEKWFGGGTCSKNLIYINMGEGISAGIMLDDSIIQGSQGFAGQIGHTVMIEQGPLCNCGNRGCLEAICGIPALLRKATEELSFINTQDALRKHYEATHQLHINDIIKIALLEESYAREIIRQAGQYVALATANLINIFNPDEVFIGGKLAVAGDIFIEEFRQIINSHVFPEVGEATAISISKLGGDSGVVGACALALKNLLKSSDSNMFEDSSDNSN